ncbi:hypothetical protein GOP47_0010693 [Adiantum capillus-veneris]|uniref:Uncharacterized protein n=1 Tax=Adiantum capillus-veneris TaxID=13818 RepID=A0A9D4UVT3_ADICA|nr:hypothetical protein GOP47_0010693 [Adiantum capillus-veneris]
MALPFHVATIKPALATPIDAATAPTTSAANIDDAFEYHHVLIQAADRHVYIALWATVIFPSVASPHLIGAAMLEALPNFNTLLAIGLVIPHYPMQPLLS